MTNREKFREVFGHTNATIYIPGGWWEETYHEPVKEDLTTIQGRIIAKMHEYGYNQKQLAKALGITEITLSRYLNGTRAIKLNTLLKMCDIFSVSSDWILGRLVDE